ncbi:hypothetical protein CDD82_2667 [Ophiocordyceps australis]|uniref:Uncharacterized protein n=1 Tax=Ophiocordyceps australis TaxID=1399860 RepID=A0A2C5ZP57_9HYPO|nr:hypothetical protein CDD82_2667 [Ophiocordyceps australis]
MGMLEPLTSLALGRSPYDPLDPDEIEGQTEPLPHEQHYGPNGRPVNPTTRRMNRDIVRAHNEVMHVIGVAEAENPGPLPEAESARRHWEYELAMGNQLLRYGQLGIEAVGIFGVHGLRQRILIYRRYSQIPFWQLYQQTKRKTSLSQDLFAGVPTSLLTNYLDGFIGDLCMSNDKWELARQCVYQFWNYLRLHLELWAVMQRLNLVSSASLLPSPSFFIPFSKDSPIPPISAPGDFSLPSLSRWMTGFLITSTPFFVWAMARSLSVDWIVQLRLFVSQHIPSTICDARKRAPPSSLCTCIPDSAIQDVENQQDATNVAEIAQTAFAEPIQGANTNSGPTVSTRRLSILSTRNDDGSMNDEEEAEGVSATLISFDVEPTESTEFPPGLWSAELRPSQTTEVRPGASHQPVYHQTMLTHLPFLLGTSVLSNALGRILVAPYEATALRMLARQFRLQHGLGVDDILGVSILNGLTWTGTINFFLSELIHLTLSGEIWAMFTSASQFVYQSDQEWREAESN